MRHSGKRDRSIKRWGLLTVFLITGFVNGVRGLASLRFAPALEGYEVAVAPAVLVGFYAIWAVLLSGEAVVCFLNAPCYARPVALAYQGLLWIVRLVSDRATNAEGIAWQNVALSVIFVALIWLFSLRRSQRPMP